MSTGAKERRERNVEEQNRQRKKRTIMMTCFRIMRRGILIVQSAKYRIAMPQLDSVMFLITATATFCVVAVMYVVDRLL
jgi:hypothetical protein